MFEWGAAQRLFCTRSAQITQALQRCSHMTGGIFQRGERPTETGCGVGCLIHSRRRFRLSASREFDHAVLYVALGMNSSASRSLSK